MGSTELFAKEKQLRSLADEVEECMDKANTACQGSGWHCENATDVRTAIREFRSKAHSAAGRIRDEADRVHKQALAAQKAEQEAVPPAPLGGPGRDQMY